MDTAKSKLRLHTQNNVSNDKFGLVDQTRHNKFHINYHKFKVECSKIRCIQWAFLLYVYRIAYAYYSRFNCYICEFLFVPEIWFLSFLKTKMVPQRNNL